MISNSKINWAVIPCAGLGTRLLPVTKTVPKAMIPVANYPIIHFAVKEAMSVGIENILIIIGEGMDSIRVKKLLQLPWFFLDLLHLLYEILQKMCD